MRKAHIFTHRKYFHDDSPVYSWCPKKKLRQTLASKCKINFLLWFPLSLLVLRADLHALQSLTDVPADMFTLMFAHLFKQPWLLLLSVMEMGKGNALRPLPKAEKEEENPPSIPRRSGAPRSFLNRETSSWLSAFIGFVSVHQDTLAVLIIHVEWDEKILILLHPYCV